LQIAPAWAGLPKFGAGAPSSAWLVAARPTVIAVTAVASSAPAMVRRRNPIPLAPVVLVVVSWVWLVFVEVFMALILHPATAAQ
jgi:hypothetical protein